MADNDFRVDQDGNVWAKNWAGQYEQKWDIWNQRPERSDGDRESQPDMYAWDGTPLYALRKERSNSYSSPSGSSDAEAALIVGLFALAFEAIGAVISEFRRPSTIILPTGKSPTLAAFYSGIIAGTGQIYLGQRKKGLLLLMIGPITFYIGLSWLVSIVSAIDAYGSGSKLRDGNVLQEWEFSLGTEAKKAWIVFGILLALGISIFVIS